MRPNQVPSYHQPVPSALKWTHSASAVFFQVPASTEIQVENLVHSLRARSDDAVILVCSTSTGESKLIERIEALLQADGISYRKAASGDLSGLLGNGSRRTPAKVLIGSESKAFTTNVIRQLKSTGGMATWDCCDQHGNSVKSGVYFVLCSQANGSGEAVVSKIAVIR